MTPTSLLAKRVSVGLVALLLSTSGLLAQDYDIPFFRPVKAGDETQMKVTSKSILTQGPADDAAKTPGSSIALMVAYNADYKCRTTAVSESGAPTSMAVTIEQLGKSVAANAGPPAQLQPRGTQVNVTSDAQGRLSFTIGADKARPDPETHAALKQTITALSPEGDDEMFGPGKAVRKNVGDRWPVNAEAISKRFAREGSPIPAEKIKGTATLEKIEEVDGVRCAIVRVETVVGQVAGLRLPANLTAKESQLTMTQVSALPLDTKLQELRRESNVTYTVIGDAKAKDGSVKPIKITVKLDRLETYGKPK